MVEGTFEELAAELKEIRENLKKRVSERTAQLNARNAELEKDNQELREALEWVKEEREQIERLIEMTRAKDEFISLASHQLRTPATGVKQYVGMILEGFAGELLPAQRVMLQKAYESNERQLQIVSDLLKVARIDAGQVKLQLSGEDLGLLIEDVLKEQDAVFSQRQQVVRFAKPVEVCTAFIDKGNIRMVLENIVDNASKYSPNGTTISIALKRGKTAFRLEVRDEGVGISSQDIPKLFQKFSRIDNPLSTLVGGTGLGLYWAKRIIDLHDGTIKVKSQLHKGTTFTIYLPRNTINGRL